MILYLIPVVLLVAAVVSFFEYITSDDDWEKRKIKAKGISCIVLFAISMGVLNVIL